MGTFDRGSFVAAAGYDIRVTVRCLVEDIDIDPMEPLAVLAGHPIIRGLVRKHDLDPSFVDTVGPEAAALTLGVLQYGARHRGAVWPDVAHNAFWLCGYGLHRSGEPDDAFVYFDELLAADRIYPITDDFVRLDLDRADRFLDAVPAEADRLRALAIARPGQIIAGRLGPVPVRLEVVEVLGLHELNVAVAMRYADIDLLFAILYALCPTADVWGAWRQTLSLPSSPLDGASAEIGYSCLLD